MFHTPLSEADEGVGAVISPEFLNQHISARLFLIGLVPTGTAGLFLAFLIGSGAPGRLDFASGWSAVNSDWTGTIPVAIVVLTVSLLAYPLQPMIVWCQCFKQIRYLRQWSLSVVLRRPRPLRAPTRLGLAIYESDRRRNLWCGFDRHRAWFRLYPLLGERIKVMVDECRNQLDFAARMSFTSGVTALATALLLARSGPWILLALAPAVLAVTAYQAAIRMAAAYNETCRAAFELHRFDLFAALHAPLPGDRTEELATAAEMNKLWSEPDFIPLHRYNHQAVPARGDGQHGR